MFINILLILGGVFIFFILLKEDVEDDFHKWENQIEINHFKEGWKRAFIMILPYMFLCLPLFLEYKNILTYSIPILLMMSSYLTLFNGWYNRKRNLSYFSLGSNDGKKDAISDRILRKIPEEIRIPLQIALPIVFLLLYLRIVFI